MIFVFVFVLIIFSQKLGVDVSPRETICMKWFRENFEILFFKMSSAELYTSMLIVKKKRSPGVFVIQFLVVTGLYVF